METSHEYFKKCPQCGSNSIIEIELVNSDSVEESGVETETEFSYECPECGCKFN